MRRALFRGRSATALLLAATLAACASRREGNFEAGGSFPFESRDVVSGPIAWEPVAEPATYAAQSLPERDVETLRLQVDGMTCPVRCAREVREMLSTVPGVLSLAVDVPSHTVLVNVARGTDPQSLVDAVTGRYRARLL